MTTRQAIPIVAKGECVEPAGSCAGLAPNITRTWWGRVLASAQHIPTGATVPLGIAVLAVGLMAVGLLGYERLATGALLCVSAGVLLWSGAIDAVHRRLPDVLTVAAAIPVTGAAVLTGPSGAVAGAVVFVAPLALIHILNPAAMGFGDVKVAAVLGAACGVIEWRLVMPSLIGACVVAGVYGLVRRRRTVAFGPALVLSTLVVIAGAVLHQSTQAVAP